MRKRRLRLALLLALLLWLTYDWGFRSGRDAGREEIAQMWRQSQEKHAVNPTALRVLNRAKRAQVKRDCR